MVSALVEIRAEGEHLHGQILQEGRAATAGRAELFAPGSITWPADGVRILDKHHGRNWRGPIRTVTGPAAS